MPSSSGYAPLPDRPSEDTPLDDDSSNSLATHPPPPSTAHRPNPTTISSSPSDTAKHVQEAFKKWSTTVQSRFHRKDRHRRRNREQSLVESRDRNLPVPVLASVFTPWEGKGKGKEEEEEEEEQSKVITLDHEPPLSRDDFDVLVNRVKDAIEHGVNPRLNAKGSSGSYFAKDASGTTVGIFKPKDEEPYGNLNPKFIKWVHRNFLSRVIPFGRSCLIPQLSYLSESAASLLDRRLGTHIVPRTEVVPLSSSAFYYDWLDLERARRSRTHQLRPKDGSFQVFLKNGFMDASDFLRKHPLPGRPLSQTLDPSNKRKHRANVFGPLRFLCGRAGARTEEDDEDDEDDNEGWGWGPESAARRASEAVGRNGFKWTEEMLESFRGELEKLVILDFLIRNTDRGLDNFMLRPCLCNSPPSTTPSSVPTPTTSAPVAQPPMTELNARRGSTLPSSSNTNTSSSTSPSTTSPHSIPTPHIHVAAIDNSLAFPHAHPLGFRSYTYGWLYLPLNIIGQPFSQATRDHFLPLLTSPKWWEETTLELRKEFAKDPDFKEGMFEKQMSVIKGQGWNVVQSLLDDEEGPVELCRRPKKLVHNLYTEVSDDDLTRSLLLAANLPPSARDEAAASTTNSPPSVPIVTTPSRPISPLQQTLNRAAAPFTSPSPSSSLASTMIKPVPMRRVSAPQRSNGGHHARKTSSSISSVLSSGMFPVEGVKSMTGEEMLRHLDRVERDGNGTGVGVAEEESEEEEEGEGEGEEGEGREPWGVRSENDWRHPRGNGGTTTTRGAVSFDSPRNASLAFVPGGKRGRSGSLSNVGSPVPNGGQRHGRYSTGDGRETSGRNGGRWDEDEDEDEEEETNGKRVVVVERLEAIKEQPRFGGWC